MGKITSFLRRLGFNRLYIVLYYFSNLYDLVFYKVLFPITLEKYSLLLYPYLVPKLSKL